VQELRKLATKETEAGLVRVQKELRHEFAKRGLTGFRTDIRIKGLWSLHRKLARKGDDITKIHDIAALRVIIKTEADCYAALGAIHALYKPLPGEFKDYIAFPKPNGYQSLHTTVLTRDAGIVEVQIRTEEMHRAAQYGIASHMSYKELGKEASRSSYSYLSFSWVRSLVPSLMRAKPAEPGAVSAVPAPRWLEELKEAHAEVAGTSEFVAGLKEDFFSHRVFVFTPAGDVIDLPAGATPIDFAYAIHGDLGDHAQGAKVNGKMVSFDTTLGNGDVVEILRRDAAHPSPKWLEIAKTSMARKRIRAALGLTSENPVPKKERKSRAAKPRNS
jgi:GTP pyrophosphokinase